MSAMMESLEGKADHTWTWKSGVMILRALAQLKITSKRAALQGREQASTHQKGYAPAKTIVHGLLVLMT